MPNAAQPCPIDLGADRLETVAFLQSLPYIPSSDRVAAYGAAECAARHREECERSADFYCATRDAVRAAGYRHGCGYEPGAHVACVAVDEGPVSLWVVRL